MIWDYNVPTIVMLTKLVEKGKTKCSQYWPEAGHQKYANLDVTLVNTITQADFVVRYFQINDVSIAGLYHIACCFLFVSANFCINQLLEILICTGNNSYAHSCTNRM